MKFASVFLQLVAVALAVPAGNARNEDANVDREKISLGEYTSMLFELDIMLTIYSNKAREDARNERHHEWKRCLGT